MVSCATVAQVPLPVLCPTGSGTNLGQAVPELERQTSMVEINKINAEKQKHFRVKAVLPESVLSVNEMAT